MIKDNFAAPCKLARELPAREIHAWKTGDRLVGAYGLRGVVTRLSDRRLRIDSGGIKTFGSQWVLEQIGWQLAHTP